MAVLDGLTDIPAKIGALGKSLAPITGFAGFLYGVDAKWMTSNTGSSYPFSTQGVYDMVGGIAGTSAVHAIGGTWGGQNRVLNVGAIMNKGTYGAIGVWALHELFPNKWTKILKDVAFPPLAGYGIGRIFDDPMAPNVDYTTAQNPNYAPGQRAPLRGSAPFLATMGHGNINSWGGMTGTSSTGTWAGVRGAQWS